MGTADHDAALDAAHAALDAITLEIARDPGLEEETKDAIFAKVDEVQAGITDASEKLEKGLKVANLLYSAFKDPLAMLGKVGGVLGI